MFTRHEAVCFGESTVFMSTKNKTQIDQMNTRDLSKTVTVKRMELRNTVGKQFFNAC